MKIQIKPQKINVNIKTGKVYPELENLEVEPSKEKQTFKSEKYGYDNVTVEAIPEDYIIPTGEIELTENGIFDIRDKATANVNFVEKNNALFDFGIVKDTNVGNVLISVITSVDDIVLDGDCQYTFKDCKNLKTIKSLTVTNCSNCLQMFQNCKELENIPVKEFDYSKLIDITDMFDVCFKLSEFPIKITNTMKVMNGTFRACYALTSIPNDWDFSGALRVSNLFNMAGIISCRKLDFRNAVEADYIFGSCKNLISCSDIDMRSVTRISATFFDCKNLTDVGEIRCDKVEYWMYPFYGCTKLVNFGGFLNAGMSYSTTSSENNSSYTVKVLDAPNLSHDSLMNIINKLYDIKTKGCKAQRLQLGSTNLAKLTEEEIAIAVSKGWSVS